MEEKEIQSQGLQALNQQQPAWESVGENGQPVAPEVETPQEDINPLQENLEQETQETLQQETQPIKQDQAPVQRQESERDYNIRLIREEREHYQRERDELARKLAQYEQAQQKQVEPEVSSLPDVADSDLVEGRHIRSVSRELKQMKQQLAQYQQVAQTNAIELQVRSNYPDFDKVVTPQAIEELKKRYPSVAATIYSSNDLYNKAASAYDLIKSLGINKKEEFVAEKSAIQSNAQKPRSAVTLAPQTGATPLSHANEFANGLTDEMKEHLYREMNDLSRMG
jgi:hypothetical protein